MTQSKVLHISEPLSKKVWKSSKGYAVPTFVIDAPGGGGKIPLLPEYLLGREGGDLVFNNFTGHQHRYPDPDGTLAKDRIFTADNLPSETVLNGSVHIEVFREGGVPCA